MNEYTINVYNVNTGKIIDTFIGEFESVDDLIKQIAIKKALKEQQYDQTRIN